MKYLDEFRNGDLAKGILKRICKEADPKRRYQLMEFCGGHTHTIHRYGIPNLLPDNVEMIHGPGCPVCVLPIGRIDHAIALANLPEVILCSYGDMLRVPGSKQISLLSAKAAGADVRMVYSINDALMIAEQNPHKKIIFFAIGFETTTPPTAVAIQLAHQHQLFNFSVFCNHLLTPVAMEALLQSENNDSINIDGFIGPAHVSIIVGSRAYQQVNQRYQKPIVIAGFEPVDVLHAILMLIRQINEKRCLVENQYQRAVNPEGNSRSLKFMSETLELRPSFEWRGLGMIADSAWQIKEKYQALDAEKIFPVQIVSSQEHRGCECANVLRGKIKPQQCKLFDKVCKPENPLGSCMVSSEGACAAVYTYGRL